MHRRDRLTCPHTTFILFLACVFQKDGCTGSDPGGLGDRGSFSCGYPSPRSLGSLDPILRVTSTLLEVCPAPYPLSPARVSDKRTTGSLSVPSTPGPMRRRPPLSESSLGRPASAASPIQTGLWLRSAFTRTTQNLLRPEGSSWISSGKCRMPCANASANVAQVYSPQPYTVLEVFKFRS